MGKSARTRSTSNKLTAVFILYMTQQFAAGAKHLRQTRRQVRPNGRLRDFLQQFVDEPEAQQYLGLIPGNAPALQIMHGLEVQLADGGPMGALHSVRIDFQLWLGVYGGFI